MASRGSREKEIRLLAIRYSPFAGGECHAKMEHDHRRGRVHELQSVHARGHGRIRRQLMARLYRADAEARAQVDQHPAEGARAGADDRHRLRSDHVQSLRRSALHGQGRRRGEKTRRWDRAHRSGEGEGAQGSGRGLSLRPHLVERGVAAAADLAVRCPPHRPGLAADRRPAIVPDRRHAGDQGRGRGDGAPGARTGSGSDEARIGQPSAGLLPQSLALLEMLHRRHAGGGDEWRRRLRRGRERSPQQGWPNGRGDHERQLWRLQIRQARRGLGHVSHRDIGEGREQEIRRSNSRGQYQSRRDQAVILQREMTDAAPLIFPQLGPLYESLAPWAEALLRVVAGLALVPHGLRNTFGMFPSTGVQSHNLTELARQLDRDGYRPGTFWSPAISITQLVCGPMLALGLFTRLVACPIVIFLVVSNYERWRVGGYFWNKTGLEYTLMWTVAALYFLVHGGGAISVDHLLFGREF